MALADASVLLVQGATKDSATIEATAAAAPAGGIAVGFLQVDNQRQVEIIQGIKQIRDVAIEQNGLELGTGFTVEVPPGGTKAEAILTAPASLQGNGIYLEVAADYPAVGNEIFHSDVATAINALMDFILKGV